MWISSVLDAVASVISRSGHHLAQEPQNCKWNLGELFRRCCSSLSRRTAVVAFSHTWSLKLQVPKWNRCCWLSALDYRVNECVLREICFCCSTESARVVCHCFHCVFARTDWKVFKLQVPKGKWMLFDLFALLFYQKVPARWYLLSLFDGKWSHRLLIIFLGVVARVDRMLLQRRVSKRN